MSRGDIYCICQHMPKTEEQEDEHGKRRYLLHYHEKR